MLINAFEYIKHDGLKTSVFKYIEMNDNCVAVIRVAIVPSPSIINAYI